jgi:hypothetical protein
MAAEPTPADDEITGYRISISTSAALDNDDSSEPYLLEYHVQIWQEWVTDGMDVESRLAGTAEGFLIRVSNAINDRICIIDEADGISHDAYEYAITVIKPGTNEWRRSVERQFPDVFDHDLLTIMKMEIKPEHRGQQVGLLTMLRIMQMMSGGCGLVVIKPWPLQYMGELSETFTEKDKKVAFQKLRAYWGRLGFERIGKTDFYGFPQSHPLPTLKSIVEADSAEVE